MSRENDHIIALGHAMQGVYNEAEANVNRIWHERLKGWLYLLRANNVFVVRTQIEKILIEAQNTENNGDSISQQKDKFGGGCG